jgi:hypothetical protein
MSVLYSAAMGARRERRLLETAAPLMHPGEAVHLIAMAKVGSLSTTVGKSVVAGVVTGVLTGGAVMVGFVQSSAYIVLTDRQLLFFEADPHTGGPGKHLFGMSRELVTTTEPKVGVFVKMRLNVQGWDKALALTFPPLPPSVRKGGIQFANALPRTTGQF